MKHVSAIENVRKSFGARVLSLRKALATEEIKLWNLTEVWIRGNVALLTRFAVESARARCTEKLFLVRYPRRLNAGGFLFSAEGLGDG